MTGRAELCERLQQANTDTLDIFDRFVTNMHAQQRVEVITFLGKIIGKLSTVLTDLQGKQETAANVVIDVPVELHKQIEELISIAQDLGRMARQTVTVDGNTYELLSDGRVRVSCAGRDGARIHAINFDDWSVEGDPRRSEEELLRRGAQREPPP